MEPTPETTIELAKIVAVVSDVAVAVAAIVAALVARSGLNAWRAELKGKSEYELAKEALNAAFTVRNEFANVRHPLMSPYEFPEHLQSGPPSAGSQRAEALAFAYENRLKPFRKAFSELEAMHVKAQVEWGAQHENKITKLRQCRGELFAAIQTTVQQAANPEAAKATPKSEEMAKLDLRITALLYGMGKDSKYGEFDREIDEAVMEFDNWLRPIIER